MGDRVNLEGRFIRLKKRQIPKPTSSTGLSLNLRWAGVDVRTALKTTSHKTMVVFKRYNTIDKDSLAAEQRQTDTFMGARQVALRESPSGAIEK
jgi:hypothetical protein